MMNGLISAVVICTLYFGLMAVVGSFSGSELFNKKASACVLLGSLLGIPVSAPLFSISRGWGYLGMALSIGLMYVLFYTNVINNLINRIPASIRRTMRTIFNVLRIVLIVAVIVVAVVGVLMYIGV